MESYLTEVVIIIEKEKLITGTLNFRPDLIQAVIPQNDNTTYISFINNNSYLLAIHPDDFKKYLDTITNIHQNFIDDVNHIKNNYND